MPKEFIHGATFGKWAKTHENCDKQGEDHCPPDCQGESVPLGDTAVKVGWTKEKSHVELAVVSMVSGMFIEQPHPKDEADLLAKGLAVPYYVQMSRDGINRMIASLRQARNDAFGKDE